MATLLRSRVRNSRPLIGFLLRNVATRAEAMIAGCWPDDEGEGGAPAAAPALATPTDATPTPANGTTMDVQATAVSIRLVLGDLGQMFDRPLALAAAQGDREFSIMRFEVIRDLAFYLGRLGLLTDRQMGALMVEGVEELLGQELRSLPPFDGDDGDDDRLVA